MYGRGNIFNRDANANANHYSTNTSYTPPNYAGGLNRSTVGQVQLIGSNRQEYKYDQPSARITEVIRGWKEHPPCSILTRQMYLHLTPAELRIEDYFLIRKKQLTTRQEPSLRDAIRKGAFNEELINIDPGPLPLVSRDPPLDIDAERRQANNDHSNIYNNNGGYNSNSNGNGYNYSSTGNQGGNAFGANNTSTGNIFTSRTGQNTGSANIFGNNANGNSSSNTNMFVRNGNGQSGSNVFNNTGQTGNMQGGNMQGGNMQGGNMQGGNMQGGNMQGGNTQTSNALFGNRTGNGPAINNSQTGNNIFRGNSTGNAVVTGTGGSNLMNNTSNLANAFNRPTASSIPTNNIFNSGNGNRTGNNLMSNQQNNGNNGYGQNGSNQQNSLFPTNPSSQLVDNLQAFLNENRQFLQMILTGKDQSKAPAAPPPPRFDYFQDRYEEQLDYSSKRRSSSPQSIIYVNIEREKDRDSPHKEKMNRKKQVKMESEVKLQPMSRRVQNSLPKQDSFGSMIHSKIKDNNLSKMQNRYTSQLRHSQFEHKAVSSLYYDCQCLIEVMLEIRWENDPLADLLPDWPAISKTVMMSCYRPNDAHCLRELRQKLKSHFPVVRMDAQFIIETTSEIHRGLAIRGTLLQKLVNISLPDYRIFYSQLRNGLFYNFTLSNTFGSVSWQRPVPLETLDFANCEAGFSIGNNIITCDVEALNSKCRVTFYDAPSKIKKAFLEDPVETQREFAVQLLSYSKHFQLQGIWRDGNNCSWSMDVQQFANEQADQ